MNWEAGCDISEPEDNMIDGLGRPSHFFKTTANCLQDRNSVK